jgi:hypothetical protein
VGSTVFSATGFPKGVAHLMGKTYFHVENPSLNSYRYFNYCHELLGEDVMGSVLKTSIIASGLAIEANAKRDSQLLVQARRNYAIALSKIYSALRSPVEAVKDGVLLAIIVLAVFETCCGSNQRK